MTDDDDDKRKRILRDGEVLHVPCLARDSAPRVPGFDAMNARDHQPGFRGFTSDAAIEAYRAMVERNQNAWKSAAQRAQDTETACEAAKVEVMTAGDAHAAADAAWREMVRRNENAWKHSR